MLADLEINLVDFGIGSTVSAKRNFLKKIIFLLKIMQVLIRPSKYRKIVFGLANVSGPSAKILTFLIKITGALNCSFNVTPTTEALSNKIDESNGLKEDSQAVDVDLILSSKNPGSKSLPESNQNIVRHVGYGRGCIDWWGAINQYSREKAHSQLPTVPFIYWPLTVLHRINNGLELHFGDATLDLLSGLAKMPAQPLIVFRYHPTTDKKHFAKIIDKSGYKNFVISCEHSNVLIERCKLVISTVGSTVFVDANYRLKPCLLYISPETLKGKADGVFNEFVFEDMAQFVVVDDLDRARELAQFSYNELLNALEKPFVDFKHDTTTDKQFICLFDR